MEMGNEWKFFYVFSLLFMESGRKSWFVMDDSGEIK